MFKILAINDVSKEEEHQEEEIIESVTKEAQVSVDFEICLIFLSFVLCFVVKF